MVDSARIDFEERDSEQMVNVLPATGAESEKKRIAQEPSNLSPKSPTEPSVKSESDEYVEDDITYGKIFKL